MSGREESISEENLLNCLAEAYALVRDGRHDVANQKILYNLQDVAVAYSLLDLARLICLSDNVPTTATQTSIASEAKKPSNEPSNDPTCLSQLPYGSATNKTKIRNWQSIMIEVPKYYKLTDTMINILATKNGSLVSNCVKLEERYVKEFVIDFDLRVLQDNARRLDFPYCQSEPIKARDTMWVVRIFPNGSNKESIGKAIVELVGASEESTDVEFQYTLKKRNCGAWEDVIDTTYTSMRQLKEVERKIVDSYRTAMLISGTSGLISEGSIIMLMLTISFCDAAPNCQNISAVRNPPSILTNEVLRERLFHKATSDVDFVVEGTRIPAHKLILSLVSPVFTAMFENQMQESVSNEIVISDFSEEVVRSMLRCIYDFDAVQTEVEKHADQLRFIANKYELSALDCAATNHIIRTITVDTAVEVLLCAHKFDHALIEEAAMDFIVKNIEHFYSLPNFVADLGTEVMSKLLRYMVANKRVHAC